MDDTVRRHIKAFKELESDVKKKKGDALVELRLKQIIECKRIVEYCDAQCEKRKEGSKEFEAWSETLCEWQDKMTMIDQDMADM